MLIMGEAVHMSRQGVYGKSLLFSTQFCYECKTALKNKIYLKKKKVTSSPGYSEIVALGVPPPLNKGPCYSHVWKPLVSCEPAPAI